MAQHVIRVVLAAVCVQVLLTGPFGVHARRIQEVRAGFDIPCEGEACSETVFCWRGARFADLHHLTRRIHGEVEFSHEQDMCVDAETDDALSLRSLLFGYDNDTAAIRLNNRIGSGKSWLSALVLRTLFGDKHKSTGDGVCEGKKCTVHFSPYGISCLRLCAQHPAKDHHVMKAEVRFRVESVLDTRALTLWALGLGLASIAPSLAERPEMFYLTGGSLGVMFAVALLVLIVSRMATRSGPTKAQLGVAAVFQVGVVYARNAVYEFIKTYVDWIALYVVVTFVASLALVHYFLKGEDGKVRLSSSLKDIVRTALQLLASFFIASPITSARYRLILTLVAFLTAVVSHMTHGSLWSALVPQLKSTLESSISKKSRDDRARRNAGSARDKSPAPFNRTSTTSTPQRSQTQRNPLSGDLYLTRDQYENIGREYTESAMKKLITPEKASTEDEKRFLDWLVHNHSRIQLTPVADKSDKDRDDNTSEEEDDLDEEDDEDVDEEMEE